MKTNFLWFKLYESSKIEFHKFVQLLDKSNINLLDRQQVDKLSGNQSFVKQLTYKSIILPKDRKKKRKNTSQLSKGDNEFREAIMAELDTSLTNRYSNSSC